MAEEGRMREKPVYTARSVQIKSEPSESETRGILSQNLLCVKKAKTVNVWRKCLCLQRGRLNSLFSRDSGCLSLSFVTK